MPVLLNQGACLPSRPRPHCLSNLGHPGLALDCPVAPTTLTNLSNPRAPEADLAIKNVQLLDLSLAQTGALSSLSYTAKNEIQAELYHPQ